MDVFLKRAIDLALDNVAEGGTPYGSVVVLDGEIIGEGVNTMHSDPDVSGHAEMVAIREAQKKLNRINLSDCVIYASGHPCPMCFSAIAISGIKHVVYANTVEEGAAVGIDIAKRVYSYLKGDHDALDLVMEHQAIDDEANDPMVAYRKKKFQE